MIAAARSCYNTGKPDSALLYARMAHERAVKCGYKKGQARSLLLMGACLSDKPEARDSTHKIIKEVLAIASSLRDTHLLIRAHKLEGHVYYMTEEWDKSMEYYQKALKLAEASSNKLEMASICRQIGVAYVSSGLDGCKPGLNYYERAFKLYEELGDTNAVAGMYFVMGIVYNNLGEVEKGKLCQEQLIRYCKLLGDESCIARAQNELAGYYQKSDLNRALDLLTDSYKRLKKAGSYDEEVANTCIKIFNVLSELKRTGETRPYLEEQLRIAIHIKNAGLEREAYRGLTGYYEFKKNYQQALFYNQKLVRSLQEANNGELPRQMAEMETKYQTEKKQAQIEGLEKEKTQQARLTALEQRKQQIIILSVTGGLALVIVFSFFLYKRFKITQKQGRIIERQKALVEEKQKELLDSIHYALRIQKSLLPTDKYIEKKLSRLAG